jgi:hypothetical protein
MALLKASRGGRSFGRRPRAWLSGLSLALAVAAAASEPSGSEYQVKAVFLYNFAHFVEWPPRAFAAPSDPIVIGVLGDDPFGPGLDEAVREERVNDRSIVVRRYRTVEEIGECHVLFVAQSAAGNLNGILTALGQRPILTVSDLENFSRGGGMIRFVTQNGKIRLRINLGAARAAGLTISSKLLRPAEIVTSEKD